MFNLPALAGPGSLVMIETWRSFVGCEQHRVLRLCSSSFGRLLPEGGTLTGQEIAGR